MSRQQKGKDGVLIGQLRGNHAGATVHRPTSFLISPLQPPGATQGQHIAQGASREIEIQPSVTDCARIFNFAKKLFEARRRSNVSKFYK